jgi:phenylacetate-CoA ligase
MLTAEARQICGRTWNVPVTDMYSTEECGYLAIQCPEHEHYHLQAESALVEILDEDGAPCAAGQVGRVVVTPLHNFATVLLRYEIGDYAEAGPPCPCGRGLPVISRILGRYRNLAVLPDGRTFWPKLGQDYVRDIAPIGQMQVVQHSLEAMEFRYTADRALSETEEAAVARHFNDSVGHPFTVSFTRLAALPRSPSGKFEDFICKVPRHGG